MDSPSADLFNSGSLEQRMDLVIDTMREMSRITDPQQLVKSYGARVRKLLKVDATVSLSRRGLTAPQYRITRSWRWEGDLNPWREADRLPIFDSGLLGELLYKNVPTLLDDFQIPADDPAAEHFEGMRSLFAIPLYDQGEAINMVCAMRKVPHGFPAEIAATQVWMSNLFGRATQNLVLSNEVKTAYEAVERELKAVADIQRSLLPAELPAIKGLELGVYYQTSRHAGGDYYDFFQLPDGQWGILIADVSGHGTPAAVLMAITHSIAHVACNPPAPPSRLFSAINKRLSETYTGNSGNFVTAFYGVYDERNRTLLWANAGHPPPRLRHTSGRVESLPQASSLPLGIEPNESYAERLTQLSRDDTLLFYTDGITEARDRDNRLLDVERLDAIFQSSPQPAPEIIKSIVGAIEQFGGGRALTDDRTLLTARVL